MSGETSRLEVLRIKDGKTESLRDVVIKESPVTIFLDDIELANLMCSPKNLDYLAVGFLFAEGLINSRKDVKKILADEKDGVVWVELKKAWKSPERLIARRFITTGCGKGLTYFDAAQDGRRLRSKSRFKVRVDSFPPLMREFLRKSRLYRLTGGVHSAAMCSARSILVFNEDIGRHSAIDKVLGECILKGIRTTDRIMVTTGRISSEILVKAARSRTPIIISKSAPTDLAVRLATDFGITLVGFARGSRMNVYSNEWRIAAGSQARQRVTRLHELVPEQKAQVIHPRRKRR
jgi:FdhD protein